MPKYDVVIGTDRGTFQATLEADPTIPTGLLLQTAMTHQQFVPHLVALDANAASTILIHTPSRQELPPGRLTVVFRDGVSFTGPVVPSPITDVPPQFNGVQLTRNLSAVVTYAVDP